MTGGFSENEKTWGLFYMESLVRVAGGRQTPATVFYLSNTCKGGKIFLFTEHYEQRGWKNTPKVVFKKIRNHYKLLTHH
jgi:hypothetical protein